MRTDKAISAQDITGLILAGGRGTRMGGLDKGLQHLAGQPLAWHAWQRLQPQVARVLLNANRHVSDYEALGWGLTLCPDHLPDFAGPLASFLAGLNHCDTTYLLTVPCDAPRFPLDLAQRLCAALQQHSAQVALAAAPQADTTGRLMLRPQPVFCLLRADLQPSLADFLHSGGRKIGAWLAQLHSVQVDFDGPTDDPHAFVNLNTLEALQALENTPPTPD